MKYSFIAGIIFLSIVSYSYSQTNSITNTSSKSELMKIKVNEYAVVKLTANISQLSDKEKTLLPILFDAAKIMDELFWEQSCKNKDELLSKITDENTSKFFMINYGPWEHLNNNKSFIEGIGEKPDCGNFYPTDMSKEEFETLKK